jgi:medium-chain acyl-[acyl-carrier-protein] hydrolase
MDYKRRIPQNRDLYKPSLADLPESNVWRDTYRIRSYEVDCRNRLSILSMFSFMQESAGRHADALGVSIHQLHSENYTWLLSRLKIKIYSYPGWNSRVRISTWPSGTRRLFALRDFELASDDDHVVAAAVSAWLVLDIQKRRPVRISPFAERLKPIEGDHILADSLDKLPGMDDCDHEKNFIVRHRDLDINQHVNNVSFVEWVLESVPPIVLKTSVPAELEINFLAEAFYEDRIRAACQAMDSCNTVFHHSLFRQQDGRELARARTVWRRIE